MIKRSKIYCLALAITFSLLFEIVFNKYISGFDFSLSSISFMMYTALFLAFFDVLYKITKKINLKQNTYMLFLCVSLLIAFSSLLIGINANTDFINIILTIFYISFISSMIFFGLEYTEERKTKN